MTSPRNTMTDATPGLPGGIDVLNAYDPARERQVVRRLRLQRWRRIALATTAICMAAVAAGAFTLANRDTIVSALSPGTTAPATQAEEPAPAAAAAVPAAPSLASASSQAVTLPAPTDQPPKAQARIIVPADPQPIQVPVIPTDPEPEQDLATAPAASQQAGGPGVRQIPLGASRAIDQAAPQAVPAAPAAALGFAAPVPPPRPANAP